MNKMHRDASNEPSYISNAPYHEERVDLACAFRWAARYNWHEAVANHFSLAVNDAGNMFLLNPNKKSFSLIKASDLLLLDANNNDTLSNPSPPDETAWWLHGLIHKYNPNIKCALHVHSIYATVLASLKDPFIKPIDQNTAMFYNRCLYDNDYGGLALEDEAKRCAETFQKSPHNILIMGNHGVMVVGESVAETFFYLYYFERAAQTYVTALSTGMELNVLSHDIATKTAEQMHDYDHAAKEFFSDLKEILDTEEPDYRC